ncbi:MAG: ATP-binding protein [Chloroflexota bacterium]|nr:ATP-binding protein [Chloroflexota bacterium]
MTEPVVNSLTVTGNAEQLGTSLQALRDFVVDASARAGLEKQSASRLRLAVDEVATNIILYGYRDSQRKGDVMIESALTSEWLRVSLIDQAVAFNPLDDHTMPSADELNDPLEERDIGGLGIYLVIRNVDEFKYEYLDGKNYNHFIMKRKNAQ